MSAKRWLFDKVIPCLSTFIKISYCLHWNICLIVCQSLRSRHILLSFFIFSSTIVSSGDGGGLCYLACFKNFEAVIAVRVNLERKETLCLTCHVLT